MTFDKSGRRKTSVLENLKDNLIILVDSVVDAIENPRTHLYPYTRPKPEPKKSKNSNLTEWAFWFFLCDFLRRDRHHNDW